VLALEELIRHPRALEHREHESGAPVDQLDRSGGEECHLLGARTGEHVDHSRLRVRSDLEPEPAEVVDHPVAVGVAA
jgi:hypothetical protein